MSHLRRPTVTGTEPVQVTLKLQPGLPSLRTAALKACVEQAIGAGDERFGMRLLEHTLEKDGLSLLVTAPHRRALSRGIQGISVRIARAVNRKLERKGRLFADRYEARLLADVRAGSVAQPKSAASKAATAKAVKAAVVKTAIPGAVLPKAAGARRKAPARASSTTRKASARSMVSSLAKRAKAAPVARA